MDFKGFLAELKKQKSTIPLSQQSEWIKYFNQHKEACQTLSQKISETDNEIDTRIFDLYALTPEEREIVMKTETYEPVFKGSQEQNKGCV